MYINNISLFSANNNQHSCQKELKELVTLQVCNKWFLISIRLEMTSEQLKQVRENCNHIPDHCLSKLFFEWEQTLSKNE